MARQASRETIDQRAYIYSRIQDCSPNDGSFTWNNHVMRFAAPYVLILEDMAVPFAEMDMPNPEKISNIVVIADEAFCFEGDAKLWKLHLPTMTWSLLPLTNVTQSLRDSSSTDDSLRILVDGHLELTQFFPTRDNCTSAVITTYLLGLSLETKDERPPIDHCAIDAGDATESHGRPSTDQCVIDIEATTESESTITQFSRCCEICSSDNPRLRAFFNVCGHIICYACALYLSDEYGKQDCPFCRKNTKFTVLVEDLAHEGNRKIPDCVGRGCCSVMKALWHLITNEVEETKEERVQRMREEDESRNTQLLRYSRRCSLCACENPSKRAASPVCGHIVCSVCADSSTDNASGLLILTCPKCVKIITFKELYEEEKTNWGDQGEDTVGSEVPTRRARRGRRRKLSTLFWFGFWSLLGLSIFIYNMTTDSPSPTPDPPQKTPESFRKTNLGEWRFAYAIGRMVDIIHMRNIEECELSGAPQAFADIRNTNLEHYIYVVHRLFELHQLMISISDDDARAFAWNVYEDGSLELYFGMIEAGRRPVRAELRASLKKIYEGYSNLPYNAKRELREKFPNIVIAIENNKFQLFWKEMFPGFVISTSQQSIENIPSIGNWRSPIH